MRHRQSLSNVLYPAVVRNDEHITDAGSQTCSAEESYVTGWNFAIDLYKVIEYLIDRSRARKVQNGVRSASPLDTIIDQSHPEPSARSLLEMMETMHDRLPSVFKSVRPMSGNDEVDCFGFQCKQASGQQFELIVSAANIILTLQTLRMVLAGLEESSVEQRCAIAGHLLDALATIPTSYIAAISATMVGFFILLGTTANETASPSCKCWPPPRQRDTATFVAMVVSSSPKCHPCHVGPDIRPRNCSCNDTRYISQT